MKKKIALILGCTGQDGSYMCEYLIKKGYHVFGLFRKSATDNKKNIQSLISNNKIFEKKFFLIFLSIIQFFKIHFFLKLYLCKTRIV